jgi:hypothetical protein
MIRDLLDIKKLKDAISKKGNLSASELDKLTYLILKYEKDDTTNLMVNMMEMLLRLQKPQNHVIVCKEQ